MRVYLCQYAPVWEDKAASHAVVDALLVDYAKGASIAPGSLIVLPEMFDTGFSINVEKTADDDGASLGYLRQLAALTGCFVIAGLSARDEADTDKPGRNRSVLIGPPTATHSQAAVIAHYDKVHPFSFGREGEVYRGGSDVVVTLLPETTAGTAGAHVWPLGMAVCYDLRFPELFRAQMQQGAQLMTVIASWPRPRQAHWRALLIARAIENQAYVIGVNRVGDDPYLKYAGGSIVVDPRGEVIAEGNDQAGVITAELDPQRVERWREAFKVLKDVQLLAPLAADGHG